MHHTHNLNYISSNKAQYIFFVFAYNKSYLNDNNQDVLYARYITITTYLLHLVNHTWMKFQTSRPNLMGVMEFLVWCPRTSPKHLQMAKLCQMILLTSVTLETLLKHCGDYKTFHHDSKLFLTHSFDGWLEGSPHVSRWPY